MLTELVSLIESDWLVLFGILFLVVLCVFALRRRHYPIQKSGYVTRVCDGDSAYVRLFFSSIKIRLAGLDAPESEQMLGDESTRYLRKAILNKRVSLKLLGKDHWGRYVAFVYCRGNCVNLQMVRSGMAWAYRQYFSTLTNEEKAAFNAAEAEAKRHRLGIWAEGLHILEPWLWRREHRTFKQKLHFVWLAIVRFFCRVFFGKRH